MLCFLTCVALCAIRSNLVKSLGLAGLFLPESCLSLLIVYLFDHDVL